MAEREQRLDVLLTNCAASMDKLTICSGKLFNVLADSARPKTRKKVPGKRNERTTLPAFLTRCRVTTNILVRIFSSRKISIPVVLPGVESRGKPNATTPYEIRR